MNRPQPIYTRDNCTFVAPLHWGLTIFWRTPMADSDWFNELAMATAADGIRLTGHRFAQPGISQFLIDSNPEISPQRIVQRVKGRLQHLLRPKLTDPFKRNYGLRSLGNVTRHTIERYVSRQLEHHRMADRRVQERFQALQIHQSEVNLALPRATKHARYWYNLHLVLVHRERRNEVRDDVLGRLRKMILRICDAKGYDLSRAAILSDHVHLTLGCPLARSPAEISLAFLTNLAFVHGMRPAYQFGAYLGTFGEYDRRAVKSDETKETSGMRRDLPENSALPRQAR